MNGRKIFFSKWGWIIIWAIASALFAFLIHYLFSKEAPTEFFIAKWGAGDILSYISTIALGLLAMWQNQKISDGSDEMQQKLAQYQEDLVVANKRANEISNLLLQMQTRIPKACFVPEYVLEGINQRFFNDEFVVRNIGNDGSVICKVKWKSGVNEREETVGQFIPNIAEANYAKVMVNASAVTNELAIYFYLKNTYSHEYIQQLLVQYQKIPTPRTSNFYSILGYEIKYYDSWTIDKGQEEP